MWELIKNNPIIKLVVILIVGILGFGILSNILFGIGYGNQNMGHEGGGYGMYGGVTSITGVLVYLYSVFFKLLVLALVISFIALAIRVAYKFTSGDSESLLKTPLADPFVRTTTMLGISVLALLIITPLLSGIFGFNLNQGMGFGGRAMNSYGYMHNQYGYGGTNVNEVIVLLLKIFLFLSVVGVLVGLAMFLLKNFSGLVISSSVVNKCPECGCKLEKTAKFCSSCGKKLPSNQQDSDTPASNDVANAPQKTGKVNEKLKSANSEDKSKGNNEV